MRLATVDLGSRTAAAVILGDGSALVLDELSALDEAIPSAVSAAFASGSMLALIAAGPAALEAAARAAAQPGRWPDAVRPPDAVRLRRPVAAVDAAASPVRPTPK